MSDQPPAEAVEEAVEEAPQVTHTVSRTGVVDVYLDGKRLGLLDPSDVAEGYRIWKSQRVGSSLSRPVGSCLTVEQGIMELSPPPPSA